VSGDKPSAGALRAAKQIVYVHLIGFETIGELMVRKKQAIIDAAEIIDRETGAAKWRGIADGLAEQLECCAEDRAELAALDQYRAAKSAEDAK